MGNEISDKRALELRFADFLRSASPHAQCIATLNEVARSRGWKLIVFGGALRDLFLGREDLIRDVDVVFSDPASSDLGNALGEFAVRRTRFGGYKLRCNGVDADAWPLSSTWAFAAGHVPRAAGHMLPRTTFLNVEAVCAELDATGLTATVHGEAFWAGTSRRELDINLQTNPYPSLCVVRSLVLAEQLQFTISDGLGRFILQEADRLGMEELLRAQLSHYGEQRLRPERIRAWLDDLRSRVGCGGDDSEAANAAPIPKAANGGSPRSRARRAKAR